MLDVSDDSGDSSSSVSFAIDSASINPAVARPTTAKPSSQSATAAAAAAGRGGGGILEISDDDVTSSSTEEVVMFKPGVGTTAAPRRRSTNNNSGPAEMSLTPDSSFLPASSSGSGGAGGMAPRLSLTPFDSRSGSPQGSFVVGPAASAAAAAAAPAPAAEGAALMLTPEETPDSQPLEPNNNNNKRLSLTPDASKPLMPAFSFDEDFELGSNVSSTSGSSPKASLGSTAVPVKASSPPKSSSIGKRRSTGSGDFSFVPSALFSSDFNIANVSSSGLPAARASASASRAASSSSASAAGGSGSVDSFSIKKASGAARSPASSTVSQEEHQRMMDAAAASKRIAEEELAAAARRRAEEEAAAAEAERKRREEAAKKQAEEEEAARKRAVEQEQLRMKRTKQILEQHATQRATVEKQEESARGRRVEKEEEAAWAALSHSESESLAAARQRTAIRIKHDHDKQQAEFAAARAQLSDAEESAARSSIVAELDAAAAALASSPAAQQWHSSVRRSLEASAEAEKQSLFRSERDEAFIEREATPGWVALFRQHLGEKLRAVESAVEPDARAAAITKPEFEARQALAQVHVDAQARESARKQGMSRLVELDGTEDLEREKITAEYNLAVASLQRQRTQLAQRLFRSQRERMEFADEGEKRAGLEREEAAAANSEMAPRHLEMQGRCRQHLVDSATAALGKAHSEHAKLLDSMQQRLRHQRLSESNAGLAALQAKEEPTQRSNIELDEAGEWNSRIVEESDFGLAMMAADKSVRDGQQQLLRDFGAAVAALRSEYQQAVTRGCGAELQCGALFIAEKEARAWTEHQERGDAVGELVAAARKVQEQRRRGTEATEAAQRRGVEQREKSDFAALENTFARGAGGAQVASVLRQLQATAEPGARNKVTAEEKREREQRILQPHRAALMGESQKHEQKNAAQRSALESEETSRRSAELTAAFETSIAALQRDFVASRKRAAVSEFVRWAEPPRRRDIEMGEMIAARDSLAPYCMSTWRPAVVRNMEWVEQQRRQEIDGGNDAFREMVVDKTREARLGAVLLLTRGMREKHEPEERSSLATQEASERESLTSMLRNGVKFIARNGIFREESSARAAVSSTREFGLGQMRRQMALLRAQDKDRHLIKKIEANVADTFFVVDAAQLKAMAGMHHIFYTVEPRQRILVENEARREFYAAILEPHVLMKSKARALELAREHGERREKIMRAYAAESKEFFSRINSAWHRAAARDRICRSEAGARAAARTEEEADAERIEAEISSWIKVAMRSLYERRDMEQRAATAMRETILRECESFAFLLCEAMSSFQYVARRALLLRSYLGKKLLSSSATSKARDIDMTTLKEEEMRLLITRHYRPLMLHNACLRRTEGAEQIARRAIRAEFKGSRSVLFLARSFTELEGKDEPTARRALAAEEAEQSGIFFDEFVQRGEVQHRLQLLEERQRGIALFSQEPARLEMVSTALHEKDFEAQLEAKSRRIAAFPAVNELERLRRRALASQRKAELDAMWTANGTELILRDEAGRRAMVLEPEQAAAFALILHLHVATGEAMLRDRVDRVEELEREGLQNLEQIAGLQVWDGTVRSSIVDQWWRGLNIFQRIEVSSRAALLLPEAVSHPQEVGRQQLAFAMQRSEMVVLSLEQRRRDEIREAVVLQDLLVRRCFHGECDAARAQLEREERDERALVLRDGGHHQDRFWAFVAAELRRVYEQGLRDLFLLQRWELTAREEVLRPRVPHGEEAAVADVMRWEARLYHESRYREHLSVKLREFIVNPFVADSLLWSRHVQCHHLVAVEEQRQRNRLAAEHQLPVLQQHDEPTARRELQQREADLRGRLTSHIFDSLRIHFSEYAIERHEAEQRRELRLRFDLGRVQLREEYFRRHIVGWAMQSMQAGDLVWALSEFEIAARVQIAEQLEAEERAAIARPYGLLQLEVAEERERRRLWGSCFDSFFGDIVSEDLFARHRTRRAAFVQSETHERLRIKKIEIASATSATEIVARRSAAEIEQRERHALERLRLLRGSEQLKAEAMLAELDRIEHDECGPELERIRERERQGQQAAEEEEMRQREVAAAAGEHHSSRFAASRRLPQKLTDVYDKMAMPSAIRPPSAALPECERQQQEEERKKHVLTAGEESDHLHRVGTAEGLDPATRPSSSSLTEEKHQLASDLRLARVHMMYEQSKMRVSSALSMSATSASRPATATHARRTPGSPPTPVHDNQLFWALSSGRTSPKIDNQQQQQQQSSAVSPLSAVSRPTSACPGFSRIQLVASRPGTAVQRRPPTAATSRPPTAVELLDDAEGRGEQLKQQQRPQSAIMRGANILKQVRGTARGTQFDSGMDMAVPGSSRELFVDVSTKENTHPPNCPCPLHRRSDVAAVPATKTQSAASRTPVKRVPTPPPVTTAAQQAPAPRTMTPAAPAVAADEGFSLSSSSSAVSSEESFSF